MSIEEIVRQGLWFIERNLHVCVELFSERIAVVDTENAFEEIDVDGDVEILPFIVICEFSDDFGHFLSLQKHSLRNT